jgi:predicted enzyme related to lactoylglutathione lyase
MPNPMVFFTIAARDAEATKRFFSELFDWQWNEGGPGIVATIDPGGPADFDPKGALTQVAPDAAPFISIFIRVDDIDATLAKAQQLGAQLVLPKVQQPGGGPHIGIIRTPEGHPIGIVQA